MHLNIQRIFIYLNEICRMQMLQIFNFTIMNYFFIVLLYKTLVVIVTLYHLYQTVKSSKTKKLIYFIIINLVLPYVYTYKVL